MLYIYIDDVHSWCLPISLGQQRTMIPVTSPSVLKPPIFRVEVVEGVKAPISDEL